QSPQSTEGTGAGGACAGVVRMMPNIHRGSAFLGVFAFALGLNTGLGQPTPKLDTLAPEWIQRGTTIEVTFTGTNLAAVNRFIFDGEPGLSATNMPAPAMPKPSVTVEAPGGGIS